MKKKRQELENWKDCWKEGSLEGWIVGLLVGRMIHWNVRWKEGSLGLFFALVVAINDCRRR